jgi:sugar/nucleoside kinase (ribokinase family)
VGTRAAERPRVLVVGDAMMDVTALIETDIVYASDTPARISLQPGGSGANTAAWLGSLGVPVTYAGAVGADAYGDVMRSNLQHFGVDCSIHVATDAPTGTCIVIVDGSGERTMFPDPGANSTLTPQMVADAMTDDVKVVHLSGYTLLNPASRAAGVAAMDLAAARGVTISLDPSSAGPLERNREFMLDVLPRVDVLLANAAEAAVLVGSDDPERALSALGAIIPLVVIKLGPRGAMAELGDERADLPAVPVDIADSTGAGDAFAAGFLGARLGGAGLPEAVSSGLSMGARAVSRVGAGPPAT